MRALVTGADGFVGRYLTAALESHGYDVCAAGGPDAAAPFLPLHITDVETLRAAFDLARPDVVFHLAARTFVPDAVANPMQTYETNALGTAALLHALREWREHAGTAARIVIVSSADVYGKQEAARYPVHENVLPHPANPYAASKLAAEAIALAEAQAYGLDVIVTRAFNHIGPGQSDRFVVASFATQLAAIAAGRGHLLMVGDVSAQRDFLDVRDVVDAYIALAQRGESAEIYNVCSGVAVSIREILAELIAIAHVPVEVREDPQRMRPSDTPVAYGDNRKLRERTGWSPKYGLRQTLRDIYACAAGAAA